jgi:hypothetical protein
MDATEFVNRALENLRHTEEMLAIRVPDARAQHRALESG